MKGTKYTHLSIIKCFRALRLQILPSRRDRRPPQEAEQTTQTSQSLAPPITNGDSDDEAKMRAEIFGPVVPDLEQTLWDVLSASAAEHPHREALVSLWQGESGNEAPPHPACLRWTYHDLLSRAETVAAALRRQGCGAGMQLAAVLWNSAEWALFLWAAARLDMTFVPIEPRVPGDVQSMLSALEPGVVVVQDSECAALGTAWRDGSNRGHVLCIQCSARPDDGWIGLAEFTRGVGVSGAYAPLTAARPDINLPVLIIFTSGTTGTPKGCIHTNRNVLSQLNRYEGNPGCSVVERWLVHTPTSHIFAVNNVLRAWTAGDTVVFPSRSFDVASTITALTQEKCSVMSATPTLAKTLTAHGSFPETEHLHLSIVTVAGTQIRKDDIDLCRQGLGAKNAIQAYGLSEGAPLISWSRTDPMLADGYHTGVGKVLPGTNVRICRQGSKDILSRGQVGELHVGGSSIISNYLGNVNCDSFYNDHHGRWLVTGDQAKLDHDGVVHILGRYKDIIIRGGENIAPQKIEFALGRIQDLEAYVVGVPDKIAGQVPVAVIQLPQHATKAQVFTEADCLGPMYSLGGVYTLEDLGFKAFPRTSLEKVKKGELQEAVIRHRAAVTSADREIGADKTDIPVSRLTAIWTELTGVRPSPQDNVVYLADSVTLLRYCDCVWTALGKRLYLQDLALHETVEKQARLLSGSDEGDFNSNLCLGDNPSETANDDRIRVAKQRLHDLGLATVKIEDLLYIRDSLHRAVIGQRPHSYQLRIVFRIKAASAARVRDGLVQGLRSRPTLRTVLCSSPHDGPFHAVVAADEHLFEHLICMTSVETEDDAREIFQDDSVEKHSSAFMFGAEIFSIKSSGASVLAMTYNHSTIDAMALLNWHKDLDGLIANPRAKLSAKTPYKLFSDLFEHFQENKLSQDAVRLYVQRLRGISRTHTALFPKQRASGWMISNDSGSKHSKEREAIRQRVWNGEWVQKKADFRYPRLGRVVNLPQLKKVLEIHGVRPSILTMGAITLFNVLQTRSAHTVFNVWVSGRSWPFVPDWIEKLLPPAMGIDGPTAQWILNMIQVDDNESIIDFLKRLVTDQQEIQLYQHAPWQKVVAELGEEGQVAVDASFRQSFVWDVSIGLAQSQAFRGDMQELEPIQRYDWADCGLFWNAFMIDSDNLYFIASWDTAQMNAAEMEGHCDTLADVMRKLTNEENWNRTVGDVLGR